MLVSVVLVGPWKFVQVLRLDSGFFFTSLRTHSEGVKDKYPGSGADFRHTNQHDTSISDAVEVINTKGSNAFISRQKSYTKNLDAIETWDVINTSFGCKEAIDCTKQKYVASIGLEEEEIWIGRLDIIWPQGTENCCSQACGGKVEIQTFSVRFRRGPVCTLARTKWPHQKGICKRLGCRRLFQNVSGNNQKDNDHY